MLDAKKLSALIRARKKARMSDPPDVASSEPMPMNANDVEQLKQDGRIEETLQSPEKTDADWSNVNMSEAEASTIGLNPDEKKRMARLRMVLANQMLSGK